MPTVTLAASAARRTPWRPFFLEVIFPSGLPQLRTRMQLGRARVSSKKMKQIEAI